jgi:hypothetical protein
MIVDMPHGMTTLAFAFFLQFLRQMSPCQQKAALPPKVLVGSNLRFFAEWCS